MLDGCCELKMFGLAATHQPSLARPPDLGQENCRSAPVFTGSRAGDNRSIAQLDMAHPPPVVDGFFSSLHTNEVLDDLMGASTTVM